MIKNNAHYKLRITFCCVTLFFLTCLAGMANADSLALSFRGNIKNASCTVDILSENIDVFLGNVSASQFKSAGDKTAPTVFGIKLTNCPPGTDSASVTFTGTPSTDSTLLALDSGGATGIAIEMEDISGQKINLGKASPYYGLVAGNENILSFSARYISTRSRVQAGKGTASAEFTVNYQ